ncbi:MAG: arylesterase [Acidobacteriaceae bacterium]|nr:arylesterase [Acidobacteriaceae bacterium]MBV9225938.1 arylesterase [Acidobacteriaceae bacterium]MBV9675815.1 arylesterase [Acidobacteriaceae bacterium]MBV9938191.1 arylesterase [Acidobacteriaceae bacterium]
MHVNLEDVERKRSSLIFAAVFCSITILLATNCGEKPAAPTQEQRTEAAPSSINPVTTPLEGPAIVTFGDSLTAGVAGRPYPDDLQDLLQQHGYKYRVDNQGVSGDTTTDGLARIDNVIATHPALVVLEFGGNDGLRGIPVESTRKNLDEMITRIQEAKIPLVLLGITLPPNYGSDYVKPFTAMFPELAKKHKIPLIPFLLVNVYKNPQLMQPDGIHPNGEGNKIVAQDVFDLIAPLLKRS